MATYNGDDNDNIYKGTSGNDIIDGYGGNDTLNGLAGYDQIFGGDGDDTLNGGVGKDTLNGGSGMDTYLIAKNDGVDYINNFDTDGSIDVVKFTDLASTDIAKITRYMDGLQLNYSSNSQLTINNYFSGADFRIDQFQFSNGVTWNWEDIKLKVVQPTDGDDQIEGYDGEHNKLNGLAGNDTIYGGNLSDTLNGGAGNDALYGGFDGDDILIGGKGDDYLNGSFYGNNILKGGLGNDYMYGSSGADTYLIAKNGGQDTIDDTGDDINVIKFIDVASTDITNVSRPSHYDDLLLTYGRNSQLTFSNYFSDSYILPDGRADQFQFSDGVIWNWDDIKLKVLQGTDDNDELRGINGEHNNLSGLAGNDLLYGGNLGDTLNGGLGDDYLEGYDGNDLLIGGRGNDILQGLSGNDTYLISKNDGKDLIHNEWQESGRVNIVKFTDVNLIGLTAINLVDGNLVINYGNNGQLTLPTNVIDKFLFADGHTLANFVIGAADNNNLTGTVANDAVAGLQGADSMAGGAGNDLYLVDNSADTITEAANAGRDTVLSSVDFTLAANVENLALLAGALTATGNNLKNVLTGNSANNTLSGLLGNDILSGGIGADTLNGGNGNDVLIGGLGKDKIILTETTAATDTVKIAAGDSKVTAYDKVIDFALGNGTATTGADKLDLDSTVIATDIAAADGINAGIIQSHSISNGIISFDDADSYAAALTLTAANLSDAFAYLQDNITANATVAFHALGNTYVFQDGGATDTLVQLTGVSASNLDNTGEVAGGVWLV